MKKKKSPKKLELSRETLQRLESSQLDKAYGGEDGTTGVNCPSNDIDTVRTCCLLLD